MILHNENQLRFPLEAARGIYGEPTSTNITCAFDAVKRAVSSGSAVDRTSRQSVVQVVSYDVESLKYMDKIAGLGPLSVLSDRLFRLYSDTLFIVQALQI